MASRVMIYDQGGAALAEVEASVTRSWVLSDVGEAAVTLAITDAKCRQEVIEFGRLVVVEHDRLPAWVGVIDVPRDWSRMKVIVKSLSAEQIFHYRVPPAVKTLTGTAGALFAEMLAIANLQGDTLMRPGEIYLGGQTRQETINLTRLLAEIKRVSNRSGHEWGVTPEIGTDGRLTLRAHWWERRGGMVDDLALEEGWNIEATDDVLSEQGEIVNWLMGYGDGATWASRPIVIRQDDDSIARYGLHQDARAYDGVTSPATLEASVLADLARLKQPRRTFGLTALDVGNTFTRVGLGNILRLRLISTGFTGDASGLEATVRVRAMEYKEAENKLDLVVDEVTL